MTTYLITRPLEEAQALARELIMGGIKSLVEPMLTLEPLTQNIPQLEDALARTPHAVLLTSRRALQALADSSSVRDVPLLVVGQATARHAQTLGFTVIAYNETAQELAALAITHLPPQAALLYARGETVSTDLASLLAAQGFSVDSVILYRATPATAFSDRLQNALAQDELTGAFFFSQRTAETYVALARHHAHHHARLIALSLSDATTEKLQALPWAAIRTAKQSDKKHILMLLNA